MSTLLTPKYLTKEICELAAETAFNAVMGKESPIIHIPKRYDAAVIVLVPAMKDARAEDYPEWPVYPTKPVCILDKWYGDETKWEHPYRDIAKCKALQLWTDRNDDRAMVVPHLLFSGDTPYWGGVKRRGFVVTCSGVQPWIDKLIAGITSDTIVALAHQLYEDDKERDWVDFLP